jgi:hypothetical protein
VNEEAVTRVLAQEDQEVPAEEAHTRQAEARREHQAT